MSKIVIRDIKDNELNDIYIINQANVPNLGTLTFEQLLLLKELSSYFKVAIVEGEIAGFVIALKENKAYNSENYKYFTQNYQEFIYIDRIAILKKFQKQSIGKLLYKDIEQKFKNNSKFMLAEVNTNPKNEQSIKFHQKCGFKIIFEKEYNKEYSVAFFAKKINDTI